MNLPNISFFRPSFSPRFFIYCLFSLILLVLAVEGGYYYWVQKRMERQQTENPVIARQEGVFTYVKSPDGTIQKMILGTVEKIDGNLLTIKTDNKKTAQVLFTGENLIIVDLTSGGPKPDYFKIGTMTDLSIGDKIRISNIYSKDKQYTAAKYLAIIRGISK